MRFVFWALCSLAIVSCATNADPPTKTNQPTDAATALDRLKQGNARFVAGKPKHPHEEVDWRLALEDGQHPYAVVLGCADSRVPPELVFDAGLGDLFVVRVVGNIVETDVTASIEYAVDHLDTPLVVVMGHTHCGAVSATVDHLNNAEGEPAEVVELLYLIEPATMGLSPDDPREKRIAQAIRRNVELGVRHLTRVPDLHRSIKAGKIKVVGAIYDMHTGKVEFFDTPLGSAQAMKTNAGDDQSKQTGSAGSQVAGE